MGKLIEQLDVIAQFKHSGEIIPMRLQMLNSAGKLEAYTIKGYRKITNNSTYTSVDNVFVTHSTISSTSLSLFVKILTYPICFCWF